MSGAPATLEDLNKASRNSFVLTLAGVFEHAPWVAETASDKRPFLTVAELHTAMMQAVIDATLDRKRHFLRGHPELFRQRSVPPGSLPNLSQSRPALVWIDCPRKMRTKFGP